MKRTNVKADGVIRYWKKGLGFSATEDTEGQVHPEAPESRWWESNISDAEKEEHLDFVRDVVFGRDDQPRSGDDIQLWSRLVTHFSTVALPGRASYSVDASINGEAYLAVLYSNELLILLMH